MILAKVAAICVLLTVGWHLPVARVMTFLARDHHTQAAVFLLVVGLCIAALAIIPFLRSTILRLTLVALVILCAAADQISLAISEQTIDPNIAQTMWRERAMADTAMIGYFRVVAQAVYWLIPLAIILAWRPTPHVALRWTWCAVPLLAFTGSLGIAKYTLNGTHEFPAFRVPVVFIVAAQQERYTGPRDAMDIVQSPRTQFRRIVMIVDESIRGDYLGINNAGVNSTPYLAGLNAGLINFGPSVAAHNCSAAARLVLRLGLQAKDLPDTSQRALKKPALWQYAKHAGYETTLIDAFPDVVTTHSYMTKVELGMIDNVIPVGDKPVYLRDQTIAKDILPRILASEDLQFVYVNKYGSHFPYNLTYPPDFKREDAPSTGDVGDRRVLVEHYKRAVTWSVDEFFKTLLAHVDLKETLIVYTSDHGQSLLEGGYKLTHCSNGKVHRGEGIVPLLAFTDDSSFGRELQQMAQSRFGTTSHFDVFPTLLLAMGYEASFVRHRYGHSLVHMPDRAHRKFLTGDIFGDLRTPVWVSVDD